MKKNKLIKVKQSFHFLLEKNEIGTLLPLLLICIIVGSVNPSFFEINNFIDILRATSYTFFVAAPLTLLLVAGGIDLSIGAMTNLGGVVCAWCLTKLGMPIFAAILVAVMVGIFMGVLKAAVVVKAGLPALITTLGLQYAINGLILVGTHGSPITGLPKEFKIIGQEKIGGIYITIIIALFVGILFHVILVKTKFGRKVCAVGGSEETARLAGINVQKTHFIVTILVSVFTVLCGVFYASRFNSAQPAIASGSELTITAAVIIGGTSNFGGYGTVFGTFLGCLLLAVINNGLVLMHVSSFWQNLIFGLILIIALFIDKYRRSRNFRSN